MRGGLRTDARSGEALFVVVVEQGLEGVVAKRCASTYRASERGWIKIKNRAYSRFGQERELARARQRQLTI